MAMRLCVKEMRSVGLTNVCEGCALLSVHQRLGRRACSGDAVPGLRSPSARRHEAFHDVWMTGPVPGRL